MYQPSPTVSLRPTPSQPLLERIPVRQLAHAPLVQPLAALRLEPIDDAERKGSVGTLVVALERLQGGTQARETRMVGFPSVCGKSFGGGRGRGWEIAKEGRKGGTNEVVVGQGDEHVPDERDQERLSLLQRDVADGRSGQFDRDGREHLWEAEETEGAEVQGQPHYATRDDSCCVRDDSPSSSSPLRASSSSVLTSYAFSPSPSSSSSTTSPFTLTLSNGTIAKSVSRSSGSRLRI